ADLDLRRGNHEAAAAFWTDNRQLLGTVAGLERRYQFASFHLEYDVWSDDPTSSLPDALSVLEQLVGTDASRLTGPLFVLAARASADAADRPGATRNGDTQQAALKAAARVFALHDPEKVAPSAAHPPPAPTTADRHTWNAETHRLRGTSDSTAWERAAGA